MTQYNLVFEKKILDFQGEFDWDDILHKFRNHFESLGYSVSENRAEEIVSESAINSYIEYGCKKSFGDYLSSIIKVRFKLDGLTINKSSEGEKFKAHLKIFVDGFFCTDLEGQWVSKPINAFIRAFLDKYIIKIKFDRGTQNQVISDCKTFQGKVLRLIFS